MRKYDSYKDSGIEWIGEIPEHWENIQIKHLAIGDNTLFLDGDWIESKEIIYDNGEYRYITTGNVGEGKYKEQGNTYITQETFEKLNCTEVVPDDLLISRLNPPIGRSCLVPDLGNKIVTSVDNVILRPSPKYKKNYLVHFFTNINYFEYTSLVGRGATMQRISRSMLGDIKIALPPTPEEQTAIANYLDRKTAEIDDLIADKKRLLELYEEEKTAIINQAVTKGINPNVPMKDSGIEWLGEIPEHWEVKKIKHLLKKKKGALKTGPFGSQLKTSDLDDNGEYKVYTQRNVLDNDFIKGEDRIDEKKFLTLKDFLVEDGDILFTSRGTIGKCNVLPSEAEAGILHPCLIRIQIDRELVCEEWILNYANNSSYFLDNVKFESNSTIIDVIYGGTLKEIVLPLASLEEQQSIVRHIETECARIDAKKAKTEKLIELLTEYRTALISEVVTGKIKVIE